MNKNNKVVMTQADIDNGKVASAGFCPIALAVKRHTNKNDVGVGYGWIREGQNLYTISKRMNQFLNKFDRYKPVKPISFFLRGQKEF